MTKAFSWSDVVAGSKEKPKLQIFSKISQIYVEGYTAYSLKGSPLRLSSVIQLSSSVLKAPKPGDRSDCESCIQALLVW